MVGEASQPEAQGVSQPVVGAELRPVAVEVSQPVVEGVVSQPEAASGLQVLRLAARLGLQALPE